MQLLERPHGGRLRQKLGLSKWDLSLVFNILTSIIYLLKLIILKDSLSTTKTQILFITEKGRVEQFTFTHRNKNECLQGAGKGNRKEFQSLF